MDTTECVTFLPITVAFSISISKHTDSEHTHDFGGIVQ